MPNVLYVVFHGLVCLVDGVKKAGADKGFRAYVLVDKDNVHKATFGDFLAEQDFAALGAGTINLGLNGLTTGADTPNAKLDRSVNPVVDLPDFPTPTDSDVRAVITLPRPNRISNFFGGIVQPNTLANGGPRPLNPPPSQISAVRIFEYNFDDPTKVFLSDDKGNVVWRCPDASGLATLPGGNLKVAAFHVYDEPPRTLVNPTPDAHNIKEFNDSMIFLGASGVQLSQPAHPIDPSTLRTTNVPGILSWEIAALDERNQDRVMKLIRAFRETGTGKPLGGGGGTQVCGGGNGSIM
jgi:hypothetical protein